MNENHLDHNAEIREGLDRVPIESFLFKKVFSIILECDQQYQTTIDSLLLEAKDRDLND